LCPGIYEAPASISNLHAHQTYQVLVSTKK
jgi:hypothetical protein